MLSRFLSVTLVVCAVLCLATTAQAELYTWFSTTVGGEWTTPANWNSTAYPNAAGDIAVFNNGRATYAITVASPVTVGEIRQPDAWERMRYISSFSGDGSLTFDNGAAEAIYDGNYRQGHPAFTMDVPIVLDSNLTFRDRGNMALSENWSFQKEISGPGRLTLLLGSENAAGTYFNLNHANSYQGGTVIGSYIATPWNTEIGATVRANADGALGSGDVELITHITQLGSVGKLAITSSGGVENRIADTASLKLNYDPTGGYTPVTLDAGVDETVAGLYFGGVPQASGTWGATGSGATNINDNYFFGTGVLNVVPEPGAIALLVSGAVMFLVYRRRRA
ncbi:MAG: PEP-CTERM sorting domain-containing protein [Proteobacteria bacterium]|nr:PEP-CTERM sorting domain-containing protein [Pseudomonadota bacterium]